jgi:hypothetical protein
MPGPVRWEVDDGRGVGAREMGAWRRLPFPALGPPEPRGRDSNRPPVEDSSETAGGTTEPRPQCTFGASVVTF